MSGILEGRKAIVTGSAQGLGEGIAEHLAQEGCDVAGWDIKTDVLEGTLERIAKQTGQRTRAMAVDVTDAEAVRQGVADAVDFLGGLDVFVANAGILISGDSLEFDADKWRKVIDVNLVGFFICAREAARVMIPNQRGSIIQINSKSGKKGSFRNSAYAAAKFGGIGVVQSLALEYAEHGVRLNAVCPGNLLNSTLWTQGPNSLLKQYARNQGLTEEQVREKYINQVPMKRPCEIRDVTNVVVFLASDAAGYMTGQAINVTGGQEMR